jgi:hypothetical protein
MSCPPFWLETPRILWDEALEFFPFTEHDTRCTASALNSFTRFGIYLGILLTVLRMDIAWILIGIVFASLSIASWKYMESHGSVREGFVDTSAAILEPRMVNGAYVPDIIGSQSRTMPSNANPFMNILMTEYSDNPTRSPAKNVQSRNNDLDKYFDTMFYNDPGDAFQHTQSQRMWISMPSTTIPNDQESYQNWLYRTPGKTCKEGNTNVCNFDAGNGILPWREIRRST